MRKLLLLLWTWLVLAFPHSAAAQGEIEIAALDVKLWPEYDQPKMLVIYDFQIRQDATLPLRMTFRLPLEAEINAVAVIENGDFINAQAEGPAVEGEWQVLTVIVETATEYRVEYYQPLTISGGSRQFEYLWPGDFKVDSFTVSVAPGRHHLR